MALLLFGCYAGGRAKGERGKTKEPGLGIELIWLFGNLHNVVAVPGRRGIGLLLLSYLQAWQES